MRSSDKENRMTLKDALRRTILLPVGGNEEDGDEGAGDEPNPPSKATA